MGSPVSASSHALRRTVRRCTAVLVAAVGVAVLVLGEGSRVAPLALVLGAVLYLGASVVQVPAWEVDGGTDEE
jgi:drug/metabolite transporter (DMT)-like permease